MERVFRTIDAMVVPTAPFLPTIAAVTAEPMSINAALGRFATPVNLLDLCALTIPAGTTGDGLPFGISLHAPAHRDGALSDLGAAFTALDAPSGPDPREPRNAYPAPTVAAPEVPAGRIGIVVAGAHLAGQPLNHQLTDRGGILVRPTTTAAHYRLYALDTEPPKPGLVWAPEGGSAIEVELWALAPDEFAGFVAAIPPPLAIGSVQLADGSTQPGFTCMPHAVPGAEDITSAGGWRAHLARESGSVETSTR